MSFELTLFRAGFSHDLQQKQTLHAIMKHNALTAHYGLSLTESQAMALVETRSMALQETGRLEFGAGILDKMILAFCDSPYLFRENYEETLHELIELFYHYKNETLDLLSDDALIAWMKTAFDGVCQGSLDLLAGRELEQLARRVRYGYRGEDAETVEDTEDEDDIS